MSGNLIAVRGTTVEVPRHDGVPLHVAPEIVHHFDTHFAGFADRTSFQDRALLTHRIDVVLTRVAVEVEVALQRATGDAWSDLWGWGPGGMGPSVGGDTFPIARAEILEFPARLRNELHTTWSDWLGDIDAEMALAGVGADDLAERPDTLALANGSLLFVRSVRVHHAFLGQNVGARVLAHALWVLSRAPGDLAMLVARPSPHPLQGASELDVSGLVRYCERIGFTRAWPDEPVTATSAVLLFAMPGKRPLRFSGLGTLGGDDGW